MKNKKGISLIVLVITIIVIIILAAAVIITLTDNNPITNAKQAAFANDLDSFKSELEMYKTKQYATTQGNYEPIKLQANENSLTYNGMLDTSENIYTVITSLKEIKKYEGKFSIVDGQLVYIGKENDPLREIAENSGIKYEVIGSPIIVSIAPQKTVIDKGEDTTYTFRVTSLVGITTTSITKDKIKLLNSLGEVISLAPENINVGALTGTTKEKEFAVTIKTGTLGYDTFKIKLEPGLIGNTESFYNQEYTTVTGFEISDKEPPVIPVITPTPTTPTNGNVTVTIAYSSDTVTSGKLYSIDNGSTWLNYTTPIVITTNNISVLAKALDEAGNESGNSTVTTIANIDKEGPVITFGTNGGNNETTVSTKINVSDINGLNTSSLQYVWDTQNVTTPVSGWTTFATGLSVSKTGDGTYYLWVKANDTFGNNRVLKSNTFIVGEWIEIASTVQTVHKTFSGATTGFNYNDPVIPTGFVAVNTTEANWNNLSTDWNKGLVIQDTSGNQFVWVPVDGTSVPYAKWCTTYHSYTYGIDGTLPSGITNEVQQITNYKGFYIGRFEAGSMYNIAGTILVVKRNYTPWTNINLPAAKTKAESLCATTKIKSGLLTGTMWDTIMKWVQNSGFNVSDSRAWGNHVDSIAPANIGNATLRTTGYSNNWKAKNIYDLAGNAFEYTNEIFQYNTAQNFSRGGSYHSSGVTFYSADTRTRDNYTSYPDIRWGFRIALYII